MDLHTLWGFLVVWVVIFKELCIIAFRRYLAHPASSFLSAFPALLSFGKREFEVKQRLDPVSLALLCAFSLLNVGGNSKSGISFPGPSRFRACFADPGVCGVSLSVNIPCIFKISLLWNFEAWLSVLYVANWVWTSVLHSCGSKVRSP